MVFASRCRQFLPIIAAALLAVGHVDSFVMTGAKNGIHQLQHRETSLNSQSRLNDRDTTPSSQDSLLSSIKFPGYAATLLAASFVFAPLAMADDTTTTSSSPSFSIQKCDISSKSPCVSTSNVRQLDLYSPPWTFPSSYGADEIMSRLKGAVVADSSCEIARQEASQYLVVNAKRPNDLFGTTDKLEFVVNAADQVITFRSSAPSESTSTDFGLQRKRLDDIRKRAGVFGIMGETMNSADTKTTGERGNGPIGQLKAFYGLQSGGGFEDVLAE